jgi:methylamine dehydrogenase accessory protein MauD
MTGGVWIASYVLLWIAVIVCAFAIVVLLRQIGVLHARIRPLGVHFAGEGLEPGSPAPRTATLEFDGQPLTLVTFTSPTCTICASLLPSLRALERSYADVRLSVVEHGPATLDVFRAYNVSSTPYVIAVGSDGLVRGGGVANSLEQVEELVETVLATDHGRAGEGSNVG